MLFRFTTECFHHLKVIDITLRVLTYKDTKEIGYKLNENKRKYFFSFDFLLNFWAHCVVYKLATYTSTPKEIFLPSILCKC